ncbi:MAG: hypothetical protein FJ265_03535 [Planctomycetes bacterium]|nr:hypothetical protein [Planctomycetota bacterium]
MSFLRLGCIAAALLAVADAAMRLTYPGRHQPPDSLLWAFDSSREASLPTWFSVVAMAWLGRCCLPLVRRSRWWLLPAVGFLLLSIDDACQLHERAGIALAPWFSGFGVYSWIAALAPLCLLGGACAFAVMWRTLPAGRARSLLVAGFLLLVAALLLEALEDRAIASGLTLRGIPLFAHTVWLEEALEMLGPVLLLGALEVSGPLPAAVAATPPGGGLSGLEPAALQPAP